MKKSLSILLALLMILSSMPIMAFTASAEQADPNVMADYTYENWQTRRWGSSNQGTESLNGGNSIYLSSVNYQTAFTTVTLEPNTTYLLDFNWKADTNENLNGIFLRHLYVFAESTYGSNEALLAPAASAAPEGGYNGSGLWHHDEGIFYPAGATGTLTSLGADLESVTNDFASRSNATAGTWQHISTKFTTNSTDTEYAIMSDFAQNSTNNPGPNAIHLSDFRLITVADSEAVAIEDKLANDWFIPANAKIYDDTSLTQDGITSDYLWTNPVYQKLSTTVTLDPNTKYVFEFDYYVEKYDANQHRMQYVEIFSAEQGSVLDAANWENENYNKEKIGLIQSWDFVDTQNDPSKTGMWHHATITFDTIGSETYNIILYGHGAGNNAHNQKIYFANFELDTFVAKKPGNILNNATYANGDVSWTTAEGQNMDARMSFADGLDNPAFSLNGGYAWVFGFGYANLTGSNYGYVYINADGLKAGKTYDLSYIHADGFRFSIDSIKSGDNAATYIVEPAITDLGNPNSKFTKGAEKATAMFTVPVDGDYVITLKSNRDNPSSYNTWNTTTLCDLELYERGAMYTVAVDTEGNGAAKADKAGMLEEGTVVTFTATPELYEEFLGWYVDGALVSEELTYTATVAGNLTPVAKFTSNSENAMADYTASDWVCWEHSQISDHSESRYGGNAYYVNKSMYQNIATEITLEPNTAYNFSFEWKAVSNPLGNAYPCIVGIYSANSGTIPPANNASPYPANGYSNLAENITYPTVGTTVLTEWNTLSANFTTTEDTTYYLTIYIQRDGSANADQKIILSDFVVKAEPVIEYTGTHYDWNGVHWSEVSDSADSHNGGYAYSVAKAMSQNINTTLTLKPGTTYRYSFDWKAIANDKGLAFAQSSSIYSANSGDSTKGNKTNYNWYDENDSAGYVPIYIPNEGYSNLMTDVSNPNGVDTAEDDVLKGWNTYSATFTTIEDEEYYLFINFGLKGAIGNQTVIISDVIIEEVTVGTAPAGDAFDAVVVHGGTSLRKENEAASSGASSAQAIRYKFTVAGDLIANAQTDGYWLEEYGAIVARADQLEGHAYDPIFGATAYSIKQGVAYNKTAGTNIVFDENENGDITFTAALYNIPGEQYGTDLAVRPYAKFMNSNGDTYIRYGATWYACVFDVAKAILDDGNADADDVNYVNNTLLAGDIKAAYDAWVAAQ
ncbi:MAG: hypothetical protein J6C29_05370 [Clostridia bacterium]|nr:hypothetical protein [Clostridia bacterium]